MPRELSILINLDTNISIVCLIMNLVHVSADRLGSCTHDHVHVFRIHSLHHSDMPRLPQQVIVQLILHSLVRQNDGLLLFDCESSACAFLLSFKYTPQYFSTEGQIFWKGVLIGARDS